MKHTENYSGEPCGSLLRERFISRVREAADIEAIASVYGRVAHQGRRALTPCPCQIGNAAPVPSLILDQHVQSGKCWLCMAQGDVFWLLMEHERICFRDAVHLLAEQFGIVEPAGTTWSTLQKRRPPATTEPGSHRPPLSLQSFEAPRELRI